MGRDYQIRVHCIEGRELQGKDSSGTSDPLVKVTCFEQDQATPPCEKAINAWWDHLLYFEKNCLEEQMKSTVVKIQVMDSNTFTRNTLIGEYVFEANFVFEKPNHEIWKQWVALTHPTLDGVQGFMRLSVQIVPSGKEPPVHKDEDDDMGDSDDLSKMVLCPPEIDRDPWVLRFEIFNSEGLPQMDATGKIDAFYTVTFAGGKGQTRVVEKNYDPEHNEEIRIPFFIPNMSDRIVMTLFDSDAGALGEGFLGEKLGLKGAMAEEVCSAFFKYSDFSANPGECKPFWVNLYGSTTSDSRSRQHKAMLSGELEASAYRGRVLVKITSEQNEVAETEVVAATSAGIPPQPIVYFLYFDLYAATEIFALLGELIYVEVSMGHNSIVSRRKKLEDGRVQWFEELEPLTVAYPEDLKQVPDIFISLMKKTPVSHLRLAYLRLKAADVIRKDWRPHPRWVIMKPDIFTPGYNSEQAPGFISYRMTFGRRDQLPPASYRPKLEVPATKPYQLRAHIYMARNLPGADANGLSDPYVTVAMAGTTKKGTRINETCFPQWYETLTLDLALPDDPKLRPDVAITVYDWDAIGGDDVLGRCLFPAKKLGRDLPDRPKWLPLYMEDPNITEGEILISFTLIPADEVNITPVPTIRPAMKSCTVEIQVVGIRDMLPKDMIPITKPFLEFDLGDKSASSSAKTKTVECRDGPNANFLEVISLKVDIPEDPLFCPSVNIKAYDSRLGGLVKPLVGSSSIPLIDYLPWIDAEDLESLANKSTFSVETERAGARWLSPTEEAELAAAQAAAAAAAAGPTGIQLGDGGQPIGADGKPIPIALDASGKPIPPDDAVVLPGAKPSGAPAPQIATATPPAGTAAASATATAPAPAATAAAPAASAPAPAPAAGSAAPAPAGAPVPDDLAPEDGIALDDKAPLVPTAQRPRARSIAESIKSYGRDSQPAEETPEEPAEAAAPTATDGEPVVSDDDDADPPPDPNDPVLGRPLVDCELEKTFTDVPFQKFDLWRGQTRGLSKADQALNPELRRKKSGYLKGNIRVIVEGEIASPAPDLAKLFKPEVYIVRTYILQGVDLVSRDSDGLSDPFVEINVGKKEGEFFSDKENYITDSAHPEIYKCFELPATIPGNSRLTIDMMDFDAIGANELIGATKIDLEDRLFNPEWKAMAKKPREIRQLYTPTTRTPQGKVILWVEILTKTEAAQTPPHKIGPPPPELYELRVIIWDAKDVAIMDPIQGTSDAFVTAIFEGADETTKQSTDIHWKADKHGMFNWRMLFSIALPMKLPRLKIQIWDKDYIGASDLIGETVLTLNAFFKKALKKKGKIQKLKSQWIDMKHPKHKDVPQARINLEMSLVPEQEAFLRPVGTGQKEPNAYPTLTPPNRPPNSINPARVDLLILYYGKFLLKYIIIAVITAGLAYALSFFFITAGAFGGLR